MELKFCSKCGKESQGNELFCRFCGNALRKEPTNETTRVDTMETSNEATRESVHKVMHGTMNETASGEESNLATPQQIQTSKFNLSKKSKIVVALIAILIIAIVSILQVGNSLADPKKVVARFEKSVATENATDLVSLLYCNDTRLVVDSNSISPLLAYFKSNPSYFNEVVSNLNHDALSPKDISNFSTESSNTLTLANIGKKYFIFPSYKINIKPSFVDITTAVKDVTFSMNNAEIGKSDTDKFTKEFGPYIPGNYSILANYTGKYVTLSQPYPVDLVAPDKGIAKLSVFNDMSYLNISSEYPDAKIFLNGKDVNVKVKDSKGFGPVDNSSKIYGTYVKDGQTLRSEEATVSGSGADIYLSFENSNYALVNVKEQLTDLLDYYTQYFTYAVNTNNISLINPYVPSGSSLYKAHLSYIPKTYLAGIQEDIVSADITSYNISDDGKSGKITTSEVYTIYAKDGTYSNKSFSYSYEFQFNEITSSYQLISIKT